MNNSSILTAKALRQSGHSYGQIAKVISKSPATAMKYCKLPELEGFTKEEVDKYVTQMKDNMFSNNQLLINKAQYGINNYLSDVHSGRKEPNPIALVAIQDRVFNQNQLLSNKPTSINLIGQAINDLQESNDKAMTLLNELSKVKGGE